MSKYTMQIPNSYPTIVIRSFNGTKKIDIFLRGRTRILKPGTLESVQFCGQKKYKSV
ncbi:unnamed protein product, partial [Nesidiocoris tenuis]